MKILWLNIDDKPTKFSDRSYLEKNLIALLSTFNYKIDNASSQWLGLQNHNGFIKESSLWNVNYVDLSYDPKFLDIFDHYVDVTIGLKANTSKSIVPQSWHQMQKNNSQLKLFN